MKRNRHSTTLVLAALLATRALLLVKREQGDLDPLTVALVLGYAVAACGCFSRRNWGFLLAAAVISLHVVRTVPPQAGELDGEFLVASFLLVGAALWGLQTSIAPYDAEAPRRPPAAHPDLGLELVRLQTFRSPAIAGLVQSFLLEAGIPAHLSGSLIEEEQPSVRVPRKYLPVAMQVMERVRRDRS